MHDDFFKVLHKDHEEVQSILKQIKKTGDGATKKREELFMKLKEEITPHMKAEEKVFYPALEQHKDVREDALESVEEHHVTELVLNELDKMPKTEEQWMAKLSVFMELVEHHIQEEESKIFKDASKVLKHDQMQQIQKRFEEEKKKVKSSLK